MDETVRVVARCHGIKPDQVRVVILDRPRNRDRIDGLRRAGASPVLIEHGDVGPSIRALIPGSDVHAVTGIGGTPEGVAMACAAAALGGEILGRMAPQRPDEAERVRERFGAIPGVMTTGDMVQGPTWFAATGITGDDLFPAADGEMTLSLAISPQRIEWVESSIVESVP